MIGNPSSEQHIHHSQYFIAWHTIPYIPLHSNLYLYPLTPMYLHYTSDYQHLFVSDPFPVIASLVLPSTFYLHTPL